MGKTLKNLFTCTLTDVCVKIVVLEICFEKNPKESLLEIFENISTIGFHC